MGQSSVHLEAYPGTYRLIIYDYYSGLIDKRRTKAWRAFVSCCGLCTVTRQSDENDPKRRWIWRRSVYVSFMLLLLLIGIIVRVSDYIPGTPGYYPNATLVNSTLYSFVHSTESSPINISHDVN